jgi:hypothetical protein
MRRQLENWLLAACDPQHGPRLQRPAPAPSDLAAILASARDHFVLGATLQSVVSYNAAPTDAHRAAAQPFIDHHRLDVGRTLGLRQLADVTARTLAAAGIPCCLLKGEDFAMRLYPSPSLRPYRDVDVLVPRAVYRDADKLIQSLGFEPHEPERKYAHDDYGQITYFAAGGEKWPLELHWNLINSPAQRQQCSLAWEDLEFETRPQPPEHVRQDEADPRWRAGGFSAPHRLTATSLLVLAAVHACVGHRFDSLQQLCDIRQICRGAAGPVDAERLAEACRRLRCATPVAWSLDMVARMLGCPATRELAARAQLADNATRSWGLLGRQTVLRPQTAASKLRRSCARLRLKNAA